MSSDLKARVAFIRKSGMFVDAEYPLLGEARLRNMDPIQHYLLVGESRNANPSSSFDTAYYRHKNRIEGDSPLLHYLLFGKARSLRCRPVAEEFRFTELNLRSGRPRVLFLIGEQFKSDLTGFEDVMRQLEIDADVLSISIDQSELPDMVQKKSAAIARPQSELPNDWKGNRFEAEQFATRFIKLWTPIAVVCLGEGGVQLVPAFSRHFLSTFCLLQAEHLRLPRQTLDQVFSHSSVVFLPTEGTKSSFLLAYPALRSRRVEVVSQAYSLMENDADQTEPLLGMLETEKGIMLKAQSQFGAILKLKNPVERAQIGTMRVQELYNRVREFLVVRARDTGKGPIFSSPKLVEFPSRDEEAEFWNKCELRLQGSRSKRVVLGEGPAELAADKKIAIHGHYYHTDLLPEFLDHLANNGTKPDLFLSTDSHEKESVLRKILESKNARAEIRVFENRGRDVGPFITGFSDLFEPGRYDILGHFHGKKSHELSGERGDIWRKSLLRRLIGLKVPVMDLVVREMSNNPSIGIVFPAIPNYCAWDENFHWGVKLADRMRLREDIARPFFDYPAGMMFWCRPETLSPLIGLNLSWEDYPAEPIPRDGTILHAIERIIPFVCEELGFDVGLI